MKKSGEVQRAPHLSRFAEIDQPLFEERQVNHNPPFQQRRPSPAKALHPNSDRSDTACPPHRAAISAATQAQKKPQSNCSIQSIPLRIILSLVSGNITGGDEVVTHTAAMELRSVGGDTVAGEGETQYSNLGNGVDALVRRNKSGMGAPAGIHPGIGTAGHDPVSLVSAVI